MKIGPIILLTWAVVLTATILTGLAAFVRRGTPTLAGTIPMTIGALLLFGFISATIGVIDGAWEFTSIGFVASIAIGSVGLFAWVLGACRLANSDDPFPDRANSRHDSDQPSPT